MKFISTPFHAIVPVLALTLLASCGGGGGGSSLVSTPATFDLSKALENYVKEAKSSQLSISATYNNVPLTGQGTLTESTTTTTFEGITAFQKTSTLTGTLSALGQSQPISSTTLSYFDSRFKPLGEEETGRYCVTTSTNPIPATAKIGDNGNWFSYTCYTSSSKNLRLGTIAVAYILEPDTATTGILKIISQFNAVSGDGYTATTTLRLTTAGELTRLSETALVSGVSITVTYR